MSIEAFQHRLNFVLAEHKTGAAMALNAARGELNAKGMSHSSAAVLMKERLAQERLDAAIRDFTTDAETAKRNGVGDEDVRLLLEGATADFLTELQAICAEPSQAAFGGHSYGVRAETFGQLRERADALLKQYAAGYLTRKTPHGDTYIGVLVSDSPGAAVQHGGQGNVQNVQVSIDTASALNSLDLLAAELAQHATANQQVQEALEDFAAIRSQLARGVPNRTLLQELGKSARSIVEGTVGGMLTPVGLAAATQLWSILGLG